MLFRNHTHMVDLLNYYAEADADWVVAELEPAFLTTALRIAAMVGQIRRPIPGPITTLRSRTACELMSPGMKDTVPEVRVDLIGARGRLSLDAEGFRLDHIRERGSAIEPYQSPVVERLSAQLDRLRHSGRTARSDRRHGDRPINSRAQPRQRDEQSPSPRRFSNRRRVATSASAWLRRRARPRRPPGCAARRDARSRPQSCRRS